VHGVGGGVGHDHDLRRTRRQVDAALAEDFQLGGRDPRVARPDNAIHRLNPQFGQSVCHRPDSLCAARDDKDVHSDKRGRAQQRLV